MLAAKPSRCTNKRGRPKPARQGHHLASGQPATILVSISDNRNVQLCLLELTQPAVWLTGLHLPRMSDPASGQLGLPQFPPWQSTVEHSPHVQVQEPPPVRMIGNSTEVRFTENVQRDPEGSFSPKRREESVNWTCHQCWISSITWMCQ